MADAWGFLKRTASAAKKPAKCAKYEQNRGKRKLQEGWKTGRSWLIIDHETHTISCKWCPDIHADQPGATDMFTWTTGKLETLKLHENSKAHIKCRDIFAGRSKAAAGEETPAIKSLQSLNKSVTDKLILLFRNAHALCLSGRPFSDFEWIARLDKVKGLDVGNTYLNDKQAKEFTDFIAKVQLNHVKEVLEEAKFVSVMSDGSTDASVTEIEIVYARVCIKGVVQVLFINAAHVSKGDAPGIVGAIQRSIENVEVPWDEFTRKLVGMGSDGASVMLGNKNGVAAHLRRLQPAVVAVHCYAHKLELAFKDAIKRVPLDTKVSTCLLQGLYYLYHNSALNRSNLKNSFHSLSMKVMLPTRIGGTRWIGHLLRALINFMAGYKAIKQHLEQVGSPTERVSNSTSGKAKGLMKLLLSKDVILYCHFMADIATILSRVSRVFQRRECCAADIHGIIEETSKLILVYSTKDGPYLSKAKAMLHLSEVLNTSRPKPGESFPAARKALIDGLLTSLSNRFEIETVIKAMEIANFKCWPLALQENKKEIEGYYTKLHEVDVLCFLLLCWTTVNFGDNQLDMIIGHYESILTQEAVDPIEAVLEWTALKSSLYESRPNDIKKLTWQQVHGIYYDRYQNILAIMDLILTVPGSSSECERGFRQMKSIKTTFRSALSEQSLSSQLIIKLHSPSIEDLDPMPAIRLWNSKTVFKRRPLFMDTAQRKTIEKAAMAVNKELTAAIPVPQHIEENTPDSEAETEPQADAIEQQHALEESKLHDSNSTDSGDEYSDDEDYGSERRVYRAMYSEGLMDENLCNVNF